MAVEFHTGRCSYNGAGTRSPFYARARKRTCTTWKLDHAGKVKQWSHWGSNGACGVMSSGGTNYLYGASNATNNWRLSDADELRPSPSRIFRYEDVSGWYRSSPFLGGNTALYRTWQASNPPSVAKVVQYHPVTGEINWQATVSSSTSFVSGKSDGSTVYVIFGVSNQRVSWGAVSGGSVSWTNTDPDAPYVPVVYPGYLPQMLGVSATRLYFSDPRNGTSLHYASKSGGGDYGSTYGGHYGPTQVVSDSAIYRLYTTTTMYHTDAIASTFTVLFTMPSGFTAVNFYYYGGYFYVVGYASGGTYANKSLLKINPSGTVVWAWGSGKPYSAYHGLYASCYTVHVNSSGVFVVGASSREYEDAAS